MKNIRVIPRLDIKGPNLVKGVHLEGLRVLGKPEYFAFKYYVDGADELIYMDVVASLYGRNNLLDIVSLTAENVFIPLTVGGGIRSVEDIRKLLRAGADKVAINTAAINNPELITQAAKTFGSQCIVVSVEAKKRNEDSYEAFTDNGRECSGVDVFQWARQAVDLGAGELLVTSIDNEGMGKGFDSELISKISKLVNVPVIACGGAGNPDHFLKAALTGCVDAISAASIFHYNRLHELESETDFNEEGNIEFLKRQKDTKRFLQSRIKPTGIQKVKEHLIDNGIKCRQLGKIKQTPECVVMEDKDSMQVGIIDYGLGNLFSIERAVRHVGAKPVVVTEAERISQFSRLILPGVGAFGDGIKGLRQRGLIESLTQAVKEGVPLLGICLGMQLLMGESFEFGHYKGLGFIEGKVIPFSDCDQKIPHIGWNSLVRPNPDQGWGNTILENLEQEVFMYFVHSFTVVPDNKDVILSHTRYGDDVFCSCLSKKNIVGCQFHPERSGEAGLNIYKSFIYGSFNN